MRTEFKSSFARDLRKIKDHQARERIHQLILLIEQSDTLDQISGIKRLQGKGEYYRIRLGDYRVGIIVSGELVTFVHYLHRKDIYRKFP